MSFLLSRYNNSQGLRYYIGSLCIVENNCMIIKNYNISTYCTGSDYFVTTSQQFITQTQLVTSI